MLKISMEKLKKEVNIRNLRFLLNLDRNYTSSSSSFKNSCLNFSPCCCSSSSYLINKKEVKSPFFLYTNIRNYSNNIQKKVYKTTFSEYQHEKANFQQPENIQKFFKKHPEWTFTDKEGDINMTLHKYINTHTNTQTDTHTNTQTDTHTNNSNNTTHHNTSSPSQNDNHTHTQQQTHNNKLKVTVEFQLVSPFQNEQQEEDNETNTEMTDFSVTIENNNTQGITFYCSTLNNDNKFRFMIGNIRYFHNEQQKNHVTSFNGPDFEDLDEGLQECIDEWLNEIGVNDEMCDFIDACSVDKEQREYIAWLNNVAQFVQQ